uniref:Alpha-1,4-N-acetylglucosaminyltransferase n=1 Tax=Timema poppense TaxID=170557 RepID=A0A7R9DCV5_TIMPO|nr:unnamed protein product [Timema poppensis]
MKSTRRATFVYALFLSCATVIITLWLIGDEDIGEDGTGTLYRVIGAPILEMTGLSNLTNAGRTSGIYCYDDKTGNAIDEIVATSVVKEDSIFFHETSCSSTREGTLVLSPRQACAVESAAKMNPDKEVYILLASPVKQANTSLWWWPARQLLFYNNIRYQVRRLLSPGGQPDSCCSTTISGSDEMTIISWWPARQLLFYNNIRIRHVNIEHYLEGTPLEEWYKEGALKKSRWPMSHSSDVLRFITLWKYGGTYLDLDVVVTNGPKGTRPNVIRPNLTGPNFIGPNPTRPNLTGPNFIRPNPTKPNLTGQQAQNLTPQDLTLYGMPA